MGNRRRRHYSTHLNHPTKLPLYGADISRGWRIVNNVSVELAEQKVERGRLVRVYNDAQEHVGYQAVDATPDATALGSRPSSAAITKSEIEANAGVVFQGGKSRTERMPEELRSKRVHPLTGKPLPAEDFVELAVAKVSAWPEVGDDRAPTSGGFRRKQGKPR